MNWLRTLTDRGLLVVTCEDAIELCGELAGLELDACPNLQKLQQHLEVLTGTEES